MENQPKEIEKMLEKLYFVRWDRFVNPTDGEYHLYGWIQRAGEDPIGRSDFIVVSYIDGRWWWITSSVRYSHEIAIIVDGTDDGHVDCERIEYSFNINNSIKL